jgi:hypothetical protein
MKRLNRHSPLWREEHGTERHELVIKLRGWPHQLEGHEAFGGPEFDDPNNGVFVRLNLLNDQFEIFGLSGLQKLGRQWGVLADVEMVTA